MDFTHTKPFIKQSSYQLREGTDGVKSLFNWMLETIVKFENM
jgi:hypothetical protein